jgi:hypothetical protein
MHLIVLGTQGSRRAASRHSLHAGSVIIARMYSLAASLTSTA